MIESLTSSKAIHSPLNKATPINAISGAGGNSGANAVAGAPANRDKVS